MTISERASYIKGLAEGLELDIDRKETKVLNAIIDLLEDIAVSVQKLEKSVDEMADQLDEVDQDLCTLEEDFYDSAEDDEEYEEYEDYEDDEEDEEEFYYEVTCPNCKETTRLTEKEMEEGSLECPKCGETLEFDMSEDEE